MNSQLTWNLVTLFGIHYSEVMMAKWKMSQVNTLCFLKKLGKWKADKVNHLTSHQKKKKKKNHEAKF